LIFGVVLLLGLTAPLATPVLAAPPHLYEYYNTGGDAPAWIGGNVWAAQTFTPGTAHTITSVKLLLSKLGNPGTVTVGIRATDVSGDPTGTDLCSGTTDSSTLLIGPNYQWREITLGSGYNLSAGTQYAIVVRAANNITLFRHLNWLQDISSPSYAGGRAETSTNGGSSWTSYINRDLMFEEWGDIAPVADPQNLSVGACNNLTVTLSGSDSDTEDDTLTYKISTLPTHDDLYDGTGTGGTHITSVPYTVTDATHKVTYQPDASYSGADNFGFKVSDGVLDSAEATISITVSAPPTADAGEDATICSGSSVQIGDSPTGSGGMGTLSYSWDPTNDLDDPTAANPYASPSATTTYTVTVTDENNCYDTDDVIVTVGEAPTAGFSADPTDTCINTDVYFTDESTGDIDSWSWDFGDGGTSSDQYPTYQYSTAGTYTVSLTVSNDCGDDTATIDDYITVGEAPTAGFSADPTDTCINTDVYFTDESTGDIDSWSWDFGDGGTSSDQYPTYQYSTAGTYTVSLTVSNDCGDDTATIDDYITVGEVPTAGFSADPTDTCINTDVYFTDESTGDIDSWYWDFGDSDNSTVQNPTHQYASAGTYTVSLTVSNDCGDDTATIDDYITVNEPPDCTIDAPDAVCENSTGNSASAPDISSADYSWSIDNGSIDGSTDTRIISWSPDPDSTNTITLYVTVTDTTTGCSSDCQKAVTVNELPDCTITLDSSSVCANSTGHTASVTAVPGATTYSWSITGNGNITSIPPYTDSITWDATAPGSATIDITITDTNSCSCTNGGQVITVNPIPVATATSNSPVCLGGTIEFTGGPGGMDSYSWTGPNGFTSDQQSPSITNATASMDGIYTLIITDGGCTSDNATVSVSITVCIDGGGVGDVGFGQTAPVAVATCPLTLTVNMLGQITTAKMTSEGVLCQDCLAFDPLKQNSWEAKAGTKLTLVNNKVPQLIKVALAGSSPSAAGAQTIGPTYTINAYASLDSTIPSAINIYPLFSMSSAYDPNGLPRNISEVIFSYYPGPSQGWLAMGSQGVVAEVGEARGTLNYFVPDTLLAKLAETAPAKFEASDLTISPARVPPNQQIIISLNVTNTGGISGDYVVELKVDGIVKSSKQVTLVAGASQTVSFTITEGSIGRYRVEIAGLEGEFVVVGQTGLNWWLIGGIIAALILTLAIWILMRWRRFSGY